MLPLILAQMTEADVEAFAGALAARLAFYGAIGGLSMAIIEVLKNLTSVRMGYNRRFLLAWFDQRSIADKAERNRRIYGVRLAGRDKAAPDNTPLKKAQTAYQQAIQLATGGHERALLDLPTEQLCGQLTAAAQVAQENPERYADFFGVLVAGADETDIKVVRGGKPADADQMGPYLDARTRLQHHVQRSLDALHILLAARWRWLIQSTVFVLCGTLAVAVMTYTWSEPGAAVPSLPARAGAIVLATLIAGFLAPVAHDLVAAIGKLKR
jgi:hypothetical protein